VLIFLLKIALLFIIVITIVYNYYNSTNFLSIIVKNLTNAVGSVFNGLLFIGLFYFIFYQNIYGNIFYCFIPTLNYINTIHIRFIYFLPVLVIILTKQYVNFVKHIMPYGAPLWLFVILPLIEFFSFIIRPLTLSIRLSTNLCAGHIIIYILSSFALNTEIPNVSIHLVIITLRVLEFIISLLQAYISCNLLILYYEEILNNFYYC